MIRKVYKTFFYYFISADPTKVIYRDAIINSKDPFHILTKNTLKPLLISQNNQQTSQELCKFFSFGSTSAHPSLFFLIISLDLEWHLEFMNKGNYANVKGKKKDKINDRYVIDKTEEE